MSNKKIKFFILIIILLFINSNFVVFWYIIQKSTWSLQTISELKGSLKDLKNKEQWLNYKLNILKWNKKLNSLFKKDLNINKINNIKSIVNKYKQINISLNIKLNKESKNLEDIITEIEHIVLSGTKVDINYYVNEEIDEADQEEVFDYFIMLQGVLEERYRFAENCNFHNYNEVFPNFL